MNDAGIGYKPDSDIKIPTNWSFETKEVASGFNRHVREQLPWYDLVTAAAVSVSRNFLVEGARAYEIGASTGNFARSLNQVIIDRKVDYIGIEKSAEMAKLYKAPGRLLVADAREISFLPYNLGICFLALMFIPKFDRSYLIDRMISSLLTGGALIIVDKFEPSGGLAGLINSRLTIAMKLEAKIEASEILAKELSLAGSQIPMERDELEVKNTKSFMFFKFGDFEAWILIKQ